MGKEEKSGGEEAARTVVFERYEMGRMLGQGTFAMVYHGRELATGEGVAIKVINKERVLLEAGLAEQICRKISVMPLVRHPYVNQLKEVLATRSHIFFVMEYMHGGELFAQIARGRLSEQQACRYFRPHV